MGGPVCNVISEESTTLLRFSVLRFAPSLVTTRPLPTPMLSLLAGATLSETCPRRCIRNQQHYQPDVGGSCQPTSHRDIACSCFDYEESNQCRPCVLPARGLATLTTAPANRFARNTFRPKECDQSVVLAETRQERELVSANQKLQDDGGEAQCADEGCQSC